MKLLRANDSGPHYHLIVTYLAVAVAGAPSVLLLHWKEPDNTSAIDSDLVKSHVD